MISPFYRAGKKSETKPEKKKAGLEVPLAVETLCGLSRRYFMAIELHFGLRGADQRPYKFGKGR